MCTCENNLLLVHSPQERSLNVWTENWNIQTRKQTLQDITNVPLSKTSGYQRSCDDSIKTLRVKTWDKYVVSLCRAKQLTLKV